jgi:hypothetical protein
MPQDLHEDDETLKDGEREGRRGAKKDFDCSVCSANNPTDDAIKDGDELTCHYCGTEFKARLDGTKLRLKEI